MTLRHLLWWPICESRFWGHEIDGQEPTRVEGVVFYRCSRCGVLVFPSVFW